MAILTSHPTTAPENKPQTKHPALLQPIRNWLDHIQVTNRRMAHLICRVIPSHCPFERDLSILGATVHIPALCRINPVYDEIVDLRLRALTYLIDVCGEDIANYVRP
ncbi:MAG: Mo-dependent nitrogenase C-terminal domain-containing protein [Cyanobacteria bacterium P01_D01_bin.156]